MRAARNIRHRNVVGIACMLALAWAAAGHEPGVAHAALVQGTVSDPTNSGLQFDGVNDFVELDAALLGTPASLTVEVWARIDSAGKLHMLVTDALDDFNDGFTLYITAMSRPAFTVAASISSKGSVTGANPLEPGVWYHIAGVYDAEAGHVGVFVNGVEEGSAAFDGSIRYSSSRDLLFASQRKSLFRNERFLRGAMDEVRIWDIARDADELAADMERELAGDEPGLIGYWPMNEGVGTLTADMSPDAANIGELIGGPVWIGTPWRAIIERIVMIDVKPRDVSNQVPVHSRGVMPVAILAQADFDAVGAIDPSSLTFGRTGDEESLHLRGLRQPNCGEEDVNDDGLADLVCHFETQLTALQAGDNRVMLRGSTRDDAGAFRGEDWVNAFERGPGLRGPGLNR